MEAEKKCKSGTLNEMWKGRRKLVDCRGTESEEFK